MAELNEYVYDVKMSSTNKNKGNDKLQYDYGADLVGIDDAQQATSLGDYIGLEAGSGSFSFKSGSIFAVSSDSVSGTDFDTLPLVARPMTAAGTAAGNKGNTAAKLSVVNPVKEYDFGFEPKTPKTPKAKLASPGKPGEAVGFNFGIETLIHGYELGFGRQPSFKRLTTEGGNPVGSAVTSNPRKVLGQNLTEGRKISIGTGGPMSPRNRRSSLLPKLPTALEDAEFARDVDALLKGYLEADSPHKRGSKGEPGKESGDFDLEAFLNRDPNALGPGAVARKPKVLTTGGRVATPPSTSRRTDGQEDSRIKDGGAFNYLDGFWNGDFSLSPATPLATSGHSSKKNRPPSRGKESTSPGTSVSSMFARPISSHSARPHDNHGSKQPKPLPSISPVTLKDKKGGRQNDVPFSEYIMEDLGGVPSCKASALPVFPATNTSSDQRRLSNANGRDNRKVTPGEYSTNSGGPSNPRKVFFDGLPLVITIRVITVLVRVSTLGPSGRTPFVDWGSLRVEATWFSSFSKSSVGDKSTTAQDAKLARANEEKANEERKERVKAFMEKRRQQKLEEEKRLQELGKQGDAEGQRTLQQQREIAASLDLTGGSGHRLAKALQRQRNKKDRNRQSLPESPYPLRESSTPGPNLKKDNSMSHDLDSALKRRRNENQVKSVIMFVKDTSSKGDGLTMTHLKDKSIIEVKSRKLIQPRYFNVDEFLPYDSWDGKTTPSKTIEEVKKKFISGANAAVMLSATESSEAGLFIAMREAMDNMYSRIPKGAELMISVAFVCGGLTEDLLSDTGRFERSTFATSPHFGVTLDGVGYVKVTSQQQLTKIIADGYKAANYSKRNQQSSGIIVTSLLLKQVKNKDVILSSLMITDAGVNCNIYRSVLKKSDSSPFALFFGILGGPVFTASVLAVGGSDPTECLQVLHVQFNLSSITNKASHTGSLTRFVELAEKELSNTTSPMDEAKRKSLEAEVAEAKKILKNPSAYVMKPSPQDLAQSRKKTQKETPSNSSAIPVSSTRVPPKTSPQRSASTPSHEPVARPAANKSEGSRVSTSAYNGGYEHRNGRTSANGERFMDLDAADSPKAVNDKTSPEPVRQAPKKKNSVHRTLPGSTVIGPGGPAWPSQRDLTVDIIDVNSIGTLSSDDDINVSSHGTSVGFTTQSDRTASGQGFSQSAKVKTLVMVDPLCKETSNVTYDNTLVIATTEDDFEEYEVDEVTELNPKEEVVDSVVLKTLCETVMSGCNAAILCADSRSSTASTRAVKSVIRSLLTSMSTGPVRGNVAVSFVKLNGETVTDLLVNNAKPQKLVVAISPIFGPCVDGVNSKRIKSAVEFDSLLTSAKKRASGDGSTTDHGLLFCSIIVKLRIDGDVLVSSLSVSFVGENIGIYNSVLDQSPLVPRALYHYALGGPCYTVAVLGISGDEKRANLMLSIQRRMGEVRNRPTYPGSIVKFISGIKNVAEPPIRRDYEATKNPELKEILDSLVEMVKDAENLLKDFEKNEPKAYLSEQDKKEKANNKPLTLKPPASRAKKDDPSRIRSVICYGQDLRGGGNVIVQENTVLVSTPNGAMRFDSDEVITLDEGEQLKDSDIVNRVVGDFLTGHQTGIITAETSIRYAFSLRALRKVAYQILDVMKGKASNKYCKGPLRGELELSMALIKDDISADLLPVEVDTMYHRFELEGTPITGPHITGVASHMVHTHEEFDHFMSVGIDNVYPALETEDPGMMVVILNLRQKVTKPTEDVLVSSLAFTAVFDAVHHYTGVLEEDPNEPLDIFRTILSAPSNTVALFGISDEDRNADLLLNTLSEICSIKNKPVAPTRISTLIKELKDSMKKMQEKRLKISSEEEKKFLGARIDAAERMLKDAESLMRYPFAEAPREFVPLGAGKF